MGAEDAPQHVQLIDDDVVEPLEEGGPLAVVGEQPVMQHLGIGEQDVGVGASPRPLLARRIPVVGGGLEAGNLQLPEAAELILGQGLGRVEQQRGAGAQARHHRLRDRDLVGQATCRTRCPSTRPPSDRLAPD